MTARKPTQGGLVVRATSWSAWPLWLTRRTREPDGIKTQWPAGSARFPPWLGTRTVRWRGTASAGRLVMVHARRQIWGFKRAHRAYCRHLQKDRRWLVNRCRL